MKTFLMSAVTVAALVSFSSVGHAEDKTMGQHASEAAHDAKVETKKAGRSAKRMAKKGAHRVEEAVCMEGDLKCAAKKAGNRVEEGKDATVDGVKGAKDELSN